MTRLSPAVMPGALDKVVISSHTKYENSDDSILTQHLPNSPRIMESFASTIILSKTGG